MLAYKGQHYKKMDQIATEYKLSVKEVSKLLDSGDITYLKIIPKGYSPLVHDLDLDNGQVEGYTFVPNVIIKERCISAEVHGNLHSISIPKWADSILPPNSIKEVDGKVQIVIDDIHSVSVSAAAKFKYLIDRDSHVTDASEAEVISRGIKVAALLSGDDNPLSEAIALEADLKGIPFKDLKDKILSKAANDLKHRAIITHLVKEYETRFPKATCWSDLINIFNEAAILYTELCNKHIVRRAL